jgi:dihydroxy-acid dehydratase
MSPGSGRRRPDRPRRGRRHIEIDIPNRTIHAKLTDEEIASRRAAMEARGDKAWKPVEHRPRKVSRA